MQIKPHQSWIRFIRNIKHILGGYKTPYCVGLDISSSAIKIVELLPNSLQIARYQIWPLASNLVNAGVINDIEQVAEIIRRRWHEFNSSYSHVAIALPYNAVIIKEISVPAVKNQQILDKLVRDQLVNELENEDIDFDYLSDPLKNQLTEQKLTVVVAKKEKIEEYQAILQMTSLQVAAIDIEPFALQHLYAKLLQNSTLNQQIIILDLGASKIRAFVFVLNQNVLFNELQVNYNSLIDAPPSIFSHATQDSSELSKAISLDVAKLMQLIKSNMLIERKLYLSEDVEVFISGGNSLTPGLASHLNLLQNLPVRLLTELFTLENQRLAQDDLARLSTAIALATWGQQLDAH